VNGLYKWRASDGVEAANIMFSGSAYAAAERAAVILAERHGISVTLWSTPSWKSLRDDAVETERWNRLHPTAPARTSTLARTLDGDAPIVAVTDYMRVVADQLAPHLPGRRFLALGTDGMGRSDTREALRRFFEIDAEHVVVAVLTTLVGSHGVTADTVARAIADLGIDPDATHALTRD
jgi:pyruvate dehydrogenase E1 component